MNASSQVNFLVAAAIASLLLSGCLLPSLHPIYTEDTRTTDDRILGTWVLERNVGEEYYLQDSMREEYKNVGFNFPPADSNFQKAMETLPKDQREEYIFGYISEVSNFNKSIWTFERAADITFDLNIPGSVNDVTISMELGAESFVPKGSRVIKKHEFPYYLLTYKEIQYQDTVTRQLMTNMTKIGGDIYLDFVTYRTANKVALLEEKNVFARSNISAHSFAKMTFDDGNLNLQMFDGEFIEDLIKNRKVRLRHEVIGDDDQILLTASTNELRSFIEKYGDDSDLFDDPQVFTKPISNN